jgi:FtsP/CotA-like multicopper oxidase with cupredoxin domain
VTDRLLRAASDRLALRLARPWVLLTFAVVLSLAGTVWLERLHTAVGEAGANGSGWSGLAAAVALALPLVLAGTWIGMLGSRRLADIAGGAGRLTGAGLVAAGIALGASLALGAMAPLQDALFGGAVAGAAPPATLWRVQRDTLWSLSVLMPLSILLALGLRRRWAAPAAAGLWLTSASAPRRAFARAGLALILVVPLVAGLQTASQRASAVTGPLGSCPAGAALRTYDVRAIDVDITLNRFGDHDPSGKMYVLENRLADVRAQEASKTVSIGLREDAIQPLVVRANMGDCVQVNFTNDASGGRFGAHIDGLAFAVDSSGDAVGRNPASDPARGELRTYTFYVPDDPTLEGAHYIRPGPGSRQAVAHGLFGALVVEPAGSTYLSPNTGQPIESGWEAMIAPAGGLKSFRENVQVYHEVGDEDFRILNKAGELVRLVDPHTDSYRPGARAINYRSEPFMNRLDRNPKQESQGYGSYAFGDPATPTMQGYLGDPTKIRVLHGGSEMFHVFHLHGGGIRWRFNPHEDTTFDYADTGLNKRPSTSLSPSTRLDSQSFGPGEAYDLQIEGGAGGVQQAAGDFLYHCHIGEHYVSGMWAFWRVFNNTQPGVLALPDRAPLAAPVDSAALIGKTYNGLKITAGNIDSWIRQQLPPKGAPTSDQDASVWNWSVNTSNAAKPIYLGEPEETEPWPDLPNVVPGHPGLRPGDQLVGNRPKILFDPKTGRPSYPLLRTNVGARPPFSPNGHSGAPYLGEQADAAKRGSVDPYFGRPDAICPAGTPARRFNVVAIERPIQVTRAGGTDPNGMIYVLAHDKADVLSGAKPAQPLALRANIGDCVAVTFASELSDAASFNGFAKVNMHIHHVQFDVQASDGVITGLAYEQSVRPYKIEDPRLSAPAAKGATTLKLTSVTKMRVGIWIGIGLGTEGIEIRQVKSVNTGAKTVTLDRALGSAHAGGQSAGTEFAQYRWYPDVALDNIFWHDHVDGIHTWAHGLVGQLIIEPKGSTYHDPTTGAQVDSGTIVDIHTNNPLVPGEVNGSFREFALWTLDENPVTDSTINLRAEPWSDRLLANPDPSLLLSSYTHGDPLTPLPRAYAGDPFVIRTINVGPAIDGLHVDGHRFWLENRYAGANGRTISKAIDTLHYGVSERFTLVLRGGAGGPTAEPGDYLYMNTVGRRFRQGAWGLLRVLPKQVGDLKPLPGTNVPTGGSLPTPTGGRPPIAAGPGEPCTPGAPQKTFAISAVDLRSSGAGGPGASTGGDRVRAAFVLTSSAVAVENGASVDPLVVHVAAGDCVTVNLSNRRVGARTSFHVGELVATGGSSGANAGFGPENTVAPGETRTYRYFADTADIGAALITDLGANDGGKLGLYGAIVVSPQGATFTDPVNGFPRPVGAQVDVHIPGNTGYRDFTLALADDDPIIGGSFMPYPTAVRNAATINYRSVPRPEGPDQFSSLVNGDPGTALLRAYAGDPVQVHALVAPGSEQAHVFSLGGVSWGSDPNLPHSQSVESKGLAPWESLDATILGGAGGIDHTVGDLFYGDLRRPFTNGGMWGLQRTLSDPTCPIRPLDGRTCRGLAP